MAVSWPAVRLVSAAKHPQTTARAQDEVPKLEQLRVPIDVSAGMLRFTAVPTQMKCDADSMQRLELPFLELWEGWAAYTGKVRAEVRADAALHCSGVSLHLIEQKRHKTGTANLALSHLETATAQI